MPMSISPMPVDVYRLDSCSRCARADNCYSTEIEIPYEGEVAICGGCIHDLAHAAGYDVDGTHLSEALNRALVAEAALDAAKAKISKLRAALK